MDIICMEKILLQETGPDSLVHAKKSFMEINVHQIKHACLTCFFRKYYNL